MDDGKSRSLSQFVKKFEQTSIDSNLEVRTMTIIFEDFLKRFRDYLVPILGETTVDAILRNAIRENRKRYHFFNSVTIKVSKISFSEVHEGGEGIDSRELLSGFLDFIQSIITLLTELTGDVLTRNVEILVNDLEKNIKGGIKDY